MSKSLLERGWGVSLNKLDEMRLEEEIRTLEKQLEEIGYPGNDPYKKMMVSAINGLICACNAFLISRASGLVSRTSRPTYVEPRHSLLNTRLSEIRERKKVVCL